MRTILALSLVLALAAPAASAQEFGAGVQASGLVPIGGLANRFTTGFGGSAFFSVHRGSPEWTGSFEYFSFTNENTDKLFVTRTATDSLTGAEVSASFPLDTLAMSLKGWGLSGTAGWELVTLGPVDLRLSLTLGFYRWTAERGGYADSLYTDIGGRQVLADVINVPAITQEDWSGGFALGLDFSVPVVQPVYLVGGARYRAIIGELWASLALDLETVSTFQMLDLRAGVEVRW